MFAHLEEKVNKSYRAVLLNQATIIYPAFYKNSNRRKHAFKNSLFVSAVSKQARLVDESPVGIKVT